MKMEKKTPQQGEELDSDDERKKAEVEKINS